MRERPKITRKDFRAWLERHKGKASGVGVPARTASCPIAQYLTNFQSISSAQVGVYQDHLAINGRNYRAPMWMTEFIDAVDKEPEGKAVRAGVALSILDEAEFISQHRLHKGDE